jgi:hypothetical protein
MTIYIDPPKYYPNCKLPYKHWSHMATNQADLTELHNMAQAIGLKRDWFQQHKTLPHYDITPNKIDLAVQHGAIVVDHETLVRKCSSIFKARENHAN